MSEIPRVTSQGLKVLGAFMERPRDEMAGAEIASSTGLLSGTLYPILVRFERAGWLESRWEAEEPEALGRPRRRYYRIRPEGQMAFNAFSPAAAGGRLSWA